MAKRRASVPEFNPDTVRAAAERGELGFEGGHLGAADEGAVGHDVLENGLQLGFDLPVLGLQVQERECS